MVPDGWVSSGIWSLAACLGVSLVTSDAHRGLVEAIGATLPRRQLAEVSHSLHREPDGHYPEERLGLGQSAAALDL